MLTLAFFFTQKEISKRRMLREEAKQNKLEAEKLAEINGIKSKFFTNISHEFRTPLSLILGPIARRISQTSDKAEKLELEIIQRNASRLLTLVNQLLDLSRLEAGMLQLKTCLEDISETVTLVASQFETNAQLKHIDFLVNAEPDLNVYFDREKLEKILMNLLSNAFKFTPSGGKVEVTVRRSMTNDSRACAEIEVRDTGIGIPQQQIDRVFDRFFQVDTSMTREFEGTGIGLSLAKDLVELHNGTITVTSEPGKGTSFVVRLPLGKDHLLPGEIISTSTESERSAILDTTGDLDSSLLPQSPPQGRFNTKILVVEDNVDLRTFIYKNLSRKFQTLLASDGQEGFDLATSEIPDIIVSDLMMPKIDGLKLCEMIKTHDATSHIPVILLTARADQMSKLQGLEKGADDYIGKPFDIAELVVRIENLVANRRRMQQKYAKDVLLNSPEIKFDSVDEVFLKKVLTYIDDNLDKPSLTVETLADECCLSQVQLYRKVKALTGNGPNELIRNVRLERAANMIKYNAGSIADIAYKCGFSNMSYFSKCFKEKYQKSPTEFRAEMANS
jgi:CheY-like chemotaxis protein/AraC-like DNA-binding protein